MKARVFRLYWSAFFIAALLLAGSCGGDLPRSDPSVPASAFTPVATQSPANPAPVSKAVTSPVPANSATSNSTTPVNTPSLGATAAPASPASTIALARGTELVFALLADNRLVAFRISDGSQAFEMTLATAPTPTAARVPGHYLALSKDGKTLYVLVPGSASSQDRIAVINPATARLQATYPFSPAVGGSANAKPALATFGEGYHNLAVGPKTGQLYLFGNYNGEVIVKSLDPTNGAELANRVARKRDGHNWLVYQGAISADERQLYISYHGEDTTGIDRFEIGEDGNLQRCPQIRPDWGCLGAHGGFAFYGDRLLVTYGYQVIVAEDPDGTIRSGYNTGLAESHVTEFVVDPQTEQLYAINTCLAPESLRGGFSIVDLRNSAMPNRATVPGGQEWGDSLLPPKVLVKPDPAQTTANDKIPCGERLALGPKGLVAAAKINFSSSYLLQASTTGAILLINGDNGQVMKNIPTLAAPLDVLVASIN